MVNDIGNITKYVKDGEIIDPVDIDMMVFDIVIDVLNDEYVYKYVENYTTKEIEEASRIEQEDRDAMAIDHEYRITLLELGV